MKQKNGFSSLLLAVLGLAAVAALMIFVIVPIIKEGHDSVPEGTQAAQTAEQTTQASADPQTQPASAEVPVTTAYAAPEPVSTEPVTTEPVTTEPVTTEAPTEPLPEPTPTDVSTGPGDVHTKAYQSGTVYISEGCGYGGYWFGEANSARYCEAVNSVARAVEGKATVYSLICPLSSGIMLSDEVRSDLGLSDQNKAIAWMYEHMDPLVKTVPGP